MNENISEKRIPPKAAAVHDLSCFGRCALTVCLPTLCAMRVQAIPLPTALLSAHTGGFDNLYFTDLTPSMREIKAHFSRLSISFDAVYTGFLGSEEQIDIVGDFIGECKRSFKPTGEKTAPVILVDPVMGDDGKLYLTYTDGLVQGMKRLCRSADIITPNITEACYLTDREYLSGEGMSKAEAVDYAHMLCREMHARYGVKKIALTGVHHTADGLKMIGTYCFEVCEDANKTGKTFLHSREGLSRHYPGTGDVFASVLLGKLLSGAPFFEAAALASDFTRDCIEYSMGFDTPQREGVLFEAELYKLFGQV